MENKLIDLNGLQAFKNKADSKYYSNDNPPPSKQITDIYVCTDNTWHLTNKPEGMKRIIFKIRFDGNFGASNVQGLLNVLGVGKKIDFFGIAYGLRVNNDIQQDEIGVITGVIKEVYMHVTYLKVSARFYGNIAVQAYISPTDNMVTVSSVTRYV